MFDEDELIKRFKQNRLYKDAISRLTADEARYVEESVEAFYRTMIRSLAPFGARLGSDPEFLKGMQEELDRRAGVVTQRKSDEPVSMTSEKDGKKRDA